MAKMKVIALVSGGKDSCYSMLCCAAHGHEVVALGNLLPHDVATDDLDSFMYQTVGHQLVGAYAACTGLPLYRRRTAARARSRGLAYEATAGDEVEDLVALLAFIKTRHPEASAVATGAIASDYQRLRVEDVCARLGLASLAYLWHRPQAQLLDCMVAANIDAVLVKVAALGLDPRRHLGRPIAAMRPILHGLRDRFGCNVCGEGGEYETLTLDCTAFKYGRIVLDSWDVRMHSPDAVAPVGVLHATTFHVEAKADGSGGSSGNGGGGSGNGGAPPGAVVVEVPDDWAPPEASTAGEEGQQKQQQQQQQQQKVDAAGSSSSGDGGSSSTSLPAVGVRDTGGHVLLTCTPPGDPGAGDGGSDGNDSAAATAAALDAALRAIAARLPGLGLDWRDSLFAHLYLADMAHFAAANAAYCRHLPRRLPPSRACVQLPLAGAAPLAVDVLFARPGGGGGDREAAAAGSRQERRRRQRPDLPRRVLHVQSISDWAPSCIGPYSQATSCGGLIHAAGQIPLDPGSMEITAAGDFDAQAALALAHMQSVAVAAGGDAARACLGLTVYLAGEAAGGADAGDGPAAAARRSVLRRLGELRRDAPGYAQRAESARLAAGGAPGFAAASGGGDDEEEEEEEGNGAFLDEYLRPPATALRLRAPVVFVGVPALPRGALIEVQPLLLDVARGAAEPPDSSSSSSSDEEEEADRQQQQQEEQQPAPSAAPPLSAAAAAASARVSAHACVSPDGACARVLAYAPTDLAADLAGGADGLADLAAAVAERLEAALDAAAPAVTGSGQRQQRRPFASVRSWCAGGGGVGAGKWAAALAAALAARELRADGGSSGQQQQLQQQQQAVQSVPVASLWVAADSGDDSGSEVECCLAVEAVVCCSD